MRRLLFTICYDGSEYHGWQVQPNGITVQQKVQEALKNVTGETCSITGCSRTDAGVHANMFCFHTDTNCHIPAERFPLALNSALPDNISATDCKEVKGDFHARYNCKVKNYIYKIYDGHIRDPFMNKFAYHHKGVLDERLMDKAAKAFIGEHDFVGFCSAGSSVVDTVRTVTECSVKRNGREIEVSITANGFLYNMVRIIVGTLVDVSDGRIDCDSVSEIINSKKRDLAGQTAPAHGLYLNRVYY